MKRINKDGLVVVALFAALIGFSLFNVLQSNERQKEQQRPYASSSAEDRGTLALHNWLQAIGYRPRRIMASPLSADEARALIVLPGDVTLTRHEAEDVIAWVERGNTLIVADDNGFARSELLDQLNVEVISVEFVETLKVDQPLLNDEAIGMVTVKTSNALSLFRNDYVSYLSTEGKPVLVSFPQGSGRVFVSSAPNLFTNAALKNDATAALVRALLAQVPLGSEVALDESHRAAAGEDGSSLKKLLYTTPWGLSILYGLGVVFAFLLMNGKRFGRVKPVTTEIVRRSPAEYAISLAQLFQRAGKQQAILQHYRRSLKLRLARPFGLEANLPDKEFVEELSRMRDDLDAPALLAALRSLDMREGARVSEAQLVQRASESEKVFSRK